MVTKREYCIFFVWSAHETFQLTVFKDDKFIESLKLNLWEAFKNHILPEIVTRKQDPNFNNTEKHYCICKRPSFPPMIACDSPGCKVEWYHYCCVGLKRAPKHEWLCPDCKKSNKQLKKK